MDRKLVPSAVGCRRDIGTLVQLGFAYHELCDFSQALVVYKKVSFEGVLSRKYSLVYSSKVT